MRLRSIFGLLALTAFLLATAPATADWGNMHRGWMHSGQPGAGYPYGLDEESGKRFDQCRLDFYQDTLKLRNDIGNAFTRLQFLIYEEDSDQAIIEETIQELNTLRSDYLRKLVEHLRTTHEETGVVCPDMLYMGGMMGPGSMGPGMVGPGMMGPGTY